MTRGLITMAIVLVACVAIADDELSFKAALRSTGVSGAELSHASNAALWRNDKEAAAVAFHRQRGSLILVFLRQPGGEFRVVDVSRIEDGNLGKVGFPRSHYDRLETLPVEWLSRDDRLFQVVFRTRAWHSGKRYTASESLLIGPDGTPLWR